MVMTQCGERVESDRGGAAEMNNNELIKAFIHLHCLGEERGKIRRGLLREIF